MTTGSLGDLELFIVINRTTGTKVTLAKWRPSSHPSGGRGRRMALTRAETPVLGLRLLLRPESPVHIPQRIVR
jgi:hypothetical protein